MKGHATLFQSLDLLRERGACVGTVWLAGDGPERAALEAQSRRLGLATRVHFLGSRDDVFGLMRSADLVVLPSLRKGHPLALLEALSLGRPCVASRVGGIPEIVESGRTGLLVPPGDPSALAEALSRLCLDRALRAELGDAAARDAKGRFDVRRTVASLEALYRQLLPQSAADSAAYPSTGPESARVT